MDTRWWPKSLPQPKAVPSAYRLYKSKCLPQPFNGFKRCCKEHAHAREIISCANDQLGPPLRICAKALRVMIKESHLPGWTLWNQSKVVQEITSRVKKLKFCPGCEHQCVICGKEKLPLEAVCADAAQFLKLLRLSMQ